MEDKNQQPFDIPVSGNLGLLALGYTGLVAWRKKKKEVRKQKMQERKQNEG
jgi:hypothetical protein